LRYSLEKERERESARACKRKRERERGRGGRERRRGRDRGEGERERKTMRTIATFICFRNHVGVQVCGFVCACVQSTVVAGSADALLQHIVTDSNMLQYTATCCNLLKLAATCCNLLQPLQPAATAATCLRRRACGGHDQDMESGRM